jgi:hypothetical protein
LPYFRSKECNPKNHTTRVTSLHVGDTPQPQGPALEFSRGFDYATVRDALCSMEKGLTIALGS